MLTGRDFVLFFLGFCPVIWFVVSRKWRRASARAEEIKRLLVLASEEAAKAEIEVNSGYAYSFSESVSPHPSIYRCAVCFFPTTTRCARCKSVRYCSGKCQIVHWRQGHKEECHPFPVIHQINDVGGGSSQKAFKQEKYDNFDSAFETAEGQCAKSVESFPEESAISSSNHSKVAGKKDDIEVECLAGDEAISGTSKSTSPSSYKGSSTSSVCSESSSDASISTSNDSDMSNGFHSPDVAADKFEEQPLSEHSTCTSPVMFNEIKLNHKDGYTQRGSSSSSAWSVDSSNGSSFSASSTPSSGFWEGTIDSRKPRTDALVDSSQSTPSDAGDKNISDSRHSPSFSSKSVKSTPPMDLPGSKAKTVISNDAGRITSEVKKPIDEAALSEESSEDVLKCRMLPPLSSVASMHMDVDSFNDSHISKSRDLKYSSSNASNAYPASNAGLHSISKDVKMVSSHGSLGSERSNHTVKDKSSTSNAMKSHEVGSLSSKPVDGHLSYSSGRDSSKSAKSVKVDDRIHGVAACSSPSAGYSQNTTNGSKTSMWKVVDQIRASKLARHYSSVAGSEISGRFSNKGLFPYELFVHLYNWKAVELRPRGLINCGNSCYANAVLQCLAFTPPLTAYFLQGFHSKACEKKEWCFTCEFEGLVLRAKEGNSPLSPIRILSQIKNIGSHLGSGREEDAHEFLRYAIDTMQSICLEEAAANDSCPLEEETTLTGLTFGGYLRSKIRCMKCGGKSERHERMMDLTVEIEGDIGTLEEALQRFTVTEILDGENKYQCSRCKSYEKAKKKLTVWEAPNVLTIALKRFQSGKFGKLNKSIRFPEILDMAPYMSGSSDTSPIYRLYGVVVHLDTMNAAFSGHYVCYVKNIQNKWFKIDDSTVKIVELERVLSKGAYMLLYARCSPRAPRSLRNSIISRDPRKSNNPIFKSTPHPTCHWDNSMTDPLTFRPILEEDSSSDNSSSLFSESCSGSTESTNRDSSSTDENYDQIFGDLGHNWNSPHRNESESDTSSCSSSPSYSKGMGGVPFLYSDLSKHSRKIVSSSYRETDSDRLVRVKSPRRI